MTQSRDFAPFRGVVQQFSAAHLTMIPERLPDAAAVSQSRHGISRKMLEWIAF
jgi:hypothetical protein